MLRFTHKQYQKNIKIFTIYPSISGSRELFVCTTIKYVINYICLTSHKAIVTNTTLEFIYTTANSKHVNLSIMNIL